MRRVRQDISHYHIEEFSLVTTGVQREKVPHVLDQTFVHDILEAQMRKWKQGNCKGAEWSNKGVEVYNIPEEARDTTRDSQRDHLKRNGKKKIVQKLVGLVIM